MPSVVIIGGGLAGMASAVTLAQSGFEVTVVEARPFLGGRASSYTLPSNSEGETVIDNCQHILLGCCRNLVDFYRRIGVGRQIRFHAEYFFLEPGGRLSQLAPGKFPPPLHFAGSFLNLPFLGRSGQYALLRALLAARWEYGRRTGLDSLSMEDWLREKRQPQDAIECFWRPVLVSAVNEEPTAISARYGLQVIRLALLSAPLDARLGIPVVPLSELYRPDALEAAGPVRVLLRAKAVGLEIEYSGGSSRVLAVEAGDRRHVADAYVCALPVERARELLPSLPIDWAEFRYSPITGIHLWFDRPVTQLPFAALLGRTLQWFFNKQDGRYLQLVVSASHALLPLSRREILDLAVRELREFLPASERAQVVNAHVVKEVRATFVAAPGLEKVRPGPETPVRNLFLAGDWTRTGWPATMEGAVRSGYQAAEAVCRMFGRPARFLIPDAVEPAL